MHSGKKITEQIEALKKAGVEAIELAEPERDGAFAATDIIDPATGEVILEANEELSERVIAMAQEKTSSAIRSSRRRTKSARCCRRP